MTDLYAGCESREDHLKRADEIYYPSFPGLHVCGGDPTDTFPITVANYPLRSDAEARRIFEIAKSECAAREGEPHDLIVDLNLANRGGNEDVCVDDFAITRQMLGRLSAIIAQQKE